MVSELYSMGLWGMQVFPVTVETDLSKGLPAFDLVGLPGTAVKESRDRVRAAIRNCGYEFPVSRITVNLAPADERKEGPLYDMPLFLSILLASGQIQGKTEDCVFFGELSLSGGVRPVNGILPMLLKAESCGFRRAFIPAENAPEGAMLSNLTVYPVAHIRELTDHFCGKQQITPLAPLATDPPCTEFSLDFCDVKGQEAVKRALEIAAGGGHNLLMVGPPGAGKSMLAKRLPSILPDMTWEETLETTKLYSICGKITQETPLIQTRPFRAPHHTVSAAGLIGGGTIPKPGEVSLAHNGVLFLDELPEFSRAAMEVLRQPIEDHIVTISRANRTISYPCSFMLIAAMNPCPCGYFGHPTRPCTCTASQVSRYLSKISGPLLDRFDIQIDVPPVDFEDLISTKKAEPSAAIRERVNQARRIQQERFKGTEIFCNANMTSHRLQEWCRVTQPAQQFLQKAFEKLGLSARAYDRVLKVARTIADLDGNTDILIPHVAEAVQYRNLDRKYWQRENP